MNNTISSNLTIIDSVMGRGKSTWAIKLINDSPNENFIVVVPTLDEVERYHQALKRPSFIPNTEETTSGSKTLQDRFRALALDSKTIITTHRMLECWDDASLEILRNKNYTLILDEVTDLVKPYAGIVKRDYELLLNDSVVAEEVQENGLVKLVAGTTAYSDDDNTGLKFSRFVTAVNNGNIYRLRGSFFLWIGSSERFRIFDDVYVMTYLFKGSVMDAWFNYHGDDYQMKSIKDGELVDYVDEGGQNFRNLIRLVEDRQLNHIGRSRHLSASWYDKASPTDLLTIRTNVQNFFRRLGLTSELVMWSTFRGKQDKVIRSVAPAKYTTTNRTRLNQALKQDPEERAKSLCHVPVNIKASNHYRHKKAVAYLANIYAFPAITGFFQDVDIYFDVDRFALSEMLQVIFRSAIREGKSIDLYVPSERMRNLLILWLNK